MTALRVAAGWVLTLGVARLWRGHPAIARGAVTVRAVEFAALVLVGAHGCRAAAQPRSPASSDAGARAPTSDFPVALGDEGVESWAELHGGRSPFATLGELLARMDEPGWTRLPEAARVEHLRRVSESAASVRGRTPTAGSLIAQLESAVERARQGRGDTLADLQAILVAADQCFAFEAWLGAWVWRRSGAVSMTASQRVGLLAQVERHLRVGEALVRALARTGGVHYVPWVMKSMAPADYGSMRPSPGVARAAAQLYPSIRLASWEDEGAIALVVDAGSAGGELWRRGARKALRPGAVLRLGRLDVVVTTDGPLVVRHAVLGRITVQMGTALHAWGLSEELDALQHSRIQGWIAAARRGDGAALHALETSLPASHALVRTDLVARPTAPGAARLRTLLALFDE